MASHRFPLAILLISVACGGSQAELVSPPPAPEQRPVPSPEPPPTAIDTITEAELRAHVELLASDKYAGRETLTDGAEMAATYLASEFKKYGLAPLPGRDSYKVPYTLHRYTYSKESNAVTFAPTSKNARALELGKEYVPFNFSDTGTVENAPVVFVGYGITAPDLGWDDYKGLDVKGKIVLVLRHWPDEKNEKGKFAGTNHGLFTAKALNAQKHGAAGMLLVTDPMHHAADSDDFSTNGFVRLPASEEEKAAFEKRQAAMRAAQKDRPKLYAAHISQEAAQALISTRRRGEKDLGAIQAKLDSGKLKPRRVVLKARASITVKDPTDPIPVQPDNVIGYLEGSDPQLKNELIVVGGHYDHLGAGTHGAGKDAGKDIIYNGADDNASGTAGVLELAQAFASLPVAPARSMVFIGFSGEEKGLLGSYAMMKEKQLDDAKIAFMLNLDMIGRNADKPVQVLGEAYATTIKEVVDNANKGIDLKIDYAGTNYSGNSDHHPFYVRDIPMMFFFTGLHKDYHQLSDHPDKVEFARMERIVRLGYGVLDQLASAKSRPSFIHNLGWLGARIQVVGDADAARATLTDLEKGSRGAKAGLMKGDAIVAIDGKPLENPNKVGARFRDIKPGTKIPVDVIRAGAKKTITVVRAKRGFLGVFPSNVTDEQKKKHGLGDDEGVGIRGVTKGGPAEKAGIKEGDILIRIAGIPVSTRSLGKALARIGAGEEVGIVVIRGDKRLDLTMVLGERTRR